MFPQMRHIQRLVVDGQEEHEDNIGVEGLLKGIERDVRVDDDVGCDERKFWE